MAIFPQKSSKIIKIQDKVNVSTFIFKCLNKTNPTNFHTWFTLSSLCVITIIPDLSILILQMLSLLGIYLYLFYRTTHYGLKQFKILGAKILTVIGQGDVGYRDLFSRAKDYPTRRSRVG